MTGLTKSVRYMDGVGGTNGALLEFKIKNGEVYGLHRQVYHRTPPISNIKHILVIVFC